MTTSRSSLRVLKAQADRIADTVKRISRGEAVGAAHDPGGKIANARKNKEMLKFGIVMDDKIITVEMTWELIEATSEVGLAEYILKQMRGARDDA